MDKSTLSHYAWMVVATIIVSAFLALAQPVGNFFSEAFQEVQQSVIDTKDNVESGEMDKEMEELFDNDDSPKINITK